MDNNNFFNFLQQGFRVTIGATTVFIETLQDSQKRQETISQLQTQWDELSQEWAKKGEQTEEDARKMMDKIWNKKSDHSSADPNSGDVTTVDVSATSAKEVDSEVKNLTQQIVELRRELEELRN